MAYHGKRLLLDYSLTPEEDSGFFFNSEQIRGVFSVMAAISIWILSTTPCSAHEGDEHCGNVGTEKFKIQGDSRSYMCSVLQGLRKCSFCKYRVVCSSN